MSHLCRGKAFPASKARGVVSHSAARPWSEHKLHHTALDCWALQHTATRCNTLQHTASHCNTLQHTSSDYWTLLQCVAVCCSVLQCVVVCRAMQRHRETRRETRIQYMLLHTATYCITLHHTATHCNTLRILCRYQWIQYTLHHSPTDCWTLLCITHIFGMGTVPLYCNTHCNTLQHTAKRCVYFVRILCITHIFGMGTVPLHCNCQHTATHCTTLQHAAYTLYHTRLWCGYRATSLQHTVNTLQHTATRCVYFVRILCITNVFGMGAVPLHCNTLPTHCNTLQHTATRCVYFVSQTSLLWVLCHFTGFSRPVRGRFKCPSSSLIHSDLCIVYFYFYFYFYFWFKIYFNPSPIHCWTLLRITHHHAAANFCDLSRSAVRLFITMHHTPTYSCTLLRYVALCIDTVNSDQNALCITLQHTTAHCNTLFELSHALQQGLQ